VHNPWIFKQAKEYMATGIVPAEPDLSEKVQILMDHFKYSVEYKGESKGLLEMRKYLSGYLRGIPNIAKFRLELMHFKTLKEVMDRLESLLLKNTLIAN
jgi:tRNA-dihydrouridine synthase B